MTMAEKTAREQIATELAGRMDDFRDILKRMESDDDEIREEASEEAYEYPLGVSTSGVVRIDLSTGGPGDWIEVMLTGEDVQRIEYHFAPWFDHASITLEGDDFDVVDAFCRHLTADYYQES